MIRHIFKVIWNERKTNAWIVLEFVLVFCILWFCCDYLYYLGGRYLEPLGFDINHTYALYVGKKETVELTEDERNDCAETFRKRVLQYPGVEQVAFGSSAVPYGRNTSAQGFHINRDSANITLQVRWVTPEFFEVFRMKLMSGKLFEGGGMSSERNAIICPARDGRFGWGYERKGEPYNLENVKTLYTSMNDEKPYTVIGTAERHKDGYYSGYRSTVIFPLGRDMVNLNWNQIVIRVAPAADKDFAKRFLRETKEQLQIGPYFLSMVIPLEFLKESILARPVTSNLNSVLAITAFLIVNIFLGILGTFWSRIQSRRSEIGLRIALGASRRKVKRQLIIETFLLLFMSSIVATILCLNIGQTDLLDSLGIPVADKSVIDTGMEQYFIDFGLTFFFLAVVSFLSVWYPARKAAKIQPAEALRNE